MTRSLKALKIEWHKQCRERTLYCYLCGQLILKESEISADHVIPQALGGETKESNLKPTHIVCNNLKGTMPVEQFQSILFSVFDGNPKDWWKLLHEQHLKKQRT